MPRKWNPLDLDYLISLYKSGKSQIGIARLCGVDKNTIARVLTDAGVQMRTQREQQILDYTGGARPTAIAKAQEAHQKSTAEARSINAKRFKYFYESGESATSIAEHLGFSRHYVSKCLRLAGVTIARGSASPSATRLTSFANGRHGAIGVGEHEVEQALNQLGEVADPQYPWRSRNLDFAITADCIAVEVIRHNSVKSNRPKFLRRLEELLDGGWRVLFVFSSGAPTVESARENLRAGLEILRSQPPGRGCYGVVRCDERWRVAVPAGLKRNDLPFVSIPENLLYPPRN